MKKYGIIVTMLSFILLIPVGWAAGQNISGQVFEKTEKEGKMPLPGVNIYWSGTTSGTFSDANGKYRLSREGITDYRLVFSFLGYRKDTVDAGKTRSKLDVQLEPDQKVLSEVEIKGRQDASFISRLNARSTQVITSAELQRAACCNLGESFETNASVDVSFSDAVTGAKQIQLLGLSGIYSQIMTENVPLIRGLATTYGLNYVPGPWMESIQVSKGTSSVIQGYESITGLINIEYKKPENSEKLYLNIYGNSDLRFEFNGNGRITFNDKLSTALMLHASDFRSKIDRNEDGFLDAPLLTTINVFNRWEYILPGKWNSHFGVKYLFEDRKGGQVSFDQKNAGSMEYGELSDTTGISADQKKYGIGVKTNRVEAFWKNGIFFKNHAHSSLGLILSGINHQQDAFYGLNKYHGHEQNLNANLVLTSELKEETHKITAGLSYMIDAYTEDFLQKRLAYRYQYLPDSVTPSQEDLFTLVGDSVVDYNFDRTEWVTGGFIEYTLNLKDKFTLIAGIRGDYNNRYGFLFTPRLHLRYKINPHLTIRGSVGKGYRSPNLLAENSQFFVSQRNFYFAPDLKQEEAWNYGVNLLWDFTLFRNTATFSFDIYRTDFVHQVVVDQDSLPTAVFYYNLDGRSYANSIQAQLTVTPWKPLSVTAAFRMNDVWITEGEVLRKKAMVSAYKGLLTLAFASKHDKWKADITGQLNGPARLPDTDMMPEQLQRPGRSPAWFNLLAQVTRKFKKFEVYLGGENLTNYRQADPIVEYQKPFHTHFDGSMVWGPVTGIMVYAGLRFILK